jgi:hypothetical protein
MAQVLQTRCPDKLLRGLILPATFQNNADQSTV